MVDRLADYARNLYTNPGLRREYEIRTSPKDMARMKSRLEAVLAGIKDPELKKAAELAFLIQLKLEPEEVQKLREKIK